MTTWQKIALGLKNLWRTCRRDGLRRTLRVFWSNYWKTETHKYDTNVAYGKWADACYRLKVAMRNAFMTFIEGDYLNHQRSIREVFCGDDGAYPWRSMNTEEQVRYFLTREVEHTEHERQVACAEKALKIYNFYTRRKPRLQRLAGEYDEMWTMKPNDEQDHPLDIYQNEKEEHYADRSYELEQQIRDEEQEILEQIAKIRPWMWV